MKLLRLNALSPDFKLPATAVTIGNFDGVHLGHQGDDSTQNCTSKGLKTLVMIFEPQPLEFLKVMMHHHGSARSKKVEYLTELGVDYIAIAKFDNNFAV
jgi:riboflavin kinase/FMN adenylyltransferase